MKPKLLDLFCGAGGAAMGYHRAGFDVVGVDIAPQKHYPFEFHQSDAMMYPLEGFDAIHASPPCQAHSALRHLHPEKNYECFIDRIREKLMKWGGPYVIENVPGAPLRNAITLCGSSFCLRVRRHRLFESNVRLKAPLCNHKDQGRPIDVSGTGGRRVNKRPDDHGGNTNKPRNIEEARNAIGINWANRDGISQAIPPAYAEFIGRQLIVFLGR